MRTKIKDFLTKNESLIKAMVLFNLLLNAGHCLYLGYKGEFHFFGTSFWFVIFAFVTFGIIFADYENLKRER
jgi:hypothetical protein